MTTQIQNTNIEKYIIKCMYNSPASIVEISQKLRKTDFTNYLYQSLFTAIRKIAVNGNISPESIMIFFEVNNKEAFNKFKECGGAMAIDKALRDATLIDSPSVEEQIKELKWLSYRRNALQVSNSIKAIAEANYNEETNGEFSNVEEMDEKIKEKVYSLAENLNTDTAIKEIGNAVDALKAEIASGEAMGIDIGGIGFPKLNRMIKRLRNGAMYVFGAPEKVGKSTFMLDLGWKIASEMGIPVAYADTEMQTGEVLLRICSKISGVEEDRIADNLLEPLEQKQVNACWEKIKKVPFYHFNANEMTNAELESQVKLLQLKHGIQILIYDYIKIQYFEAEKGRPDLILASKLDTLKERIAKQCDIPIITSGQMYPKTDERGNHNKFAETSHFTKLADVICRLDKVDPTDPNQLGTHYIELLMGRKVRTDLIGQKIFFNFTMPIHKIEELK